MPVEAHILGDKEGRNGRGVPVPGKLYRPAGPIHFFSGQNYGAPNSQLSIARDTPAGRYDVLIFLRHSLEARVFFPAVDFTNVHPSKQDYLVLHFIWSDLCVWNRWYLSPDVSSRIQTNNIFSVKFLGPLQC